MDYSEKLMAILAKVFNDGKLEEHICDEAINLPTDIKYDAVFSDSVFQYFSDYDYAEKVLEKMTLKATKSDQKRWDS